jgi:peroxiredoxin Q/BCP
MTEPTLDEAAPDLELEATGGKTVRLSDLKGSNVVLYFYPKDNTPGCIKEGEAFRDRWSELQALDAVVLGVSRDGIKSHENFKARREFPFDLLSDPEERACRAYDVIRMKKMFGKESLGLVRSTFLIDKHGILRRAWRQVKVDGHAEQVLEALRELQG